MRRAPPVLRTLEESNRTLTATGRSRPELRVPHQRPRRSRMTEPENVEFHERIERPIVPGATRPERHRAGRGRPVRRRRRGRDGRVAVASAVDHRRLAARRPRRAHPTTDKAGDRRPARLRRPRLRPRRLRLRRHHDHARSTARTCRSRPRTAGPARSRSTSDTTITKAGTTIALGDLEVGDQIVLPPGPPDRRHVHDHGDQRGPAEHRGQVTSRRRLHDHRRAA